jgi:hypothetical protein
MTVTGTNVTFNVGFNGNLTAEMTKISYPTSQGIEEYFQDGKFDLVDLLGAVPIVGPLLKTGYNLISGLIGESGQATAGTVTTYVPRPEVYRTKPPLVDHLYLDRYSRSLKRNINERISYIATRAKFNQLKNITFTNSSYF